MDCCILTANVRKSGFGDINQDRLRKIIPLITEAYKLPRQPKVEEVFDPAYLPPASERMIN